MLKFPSVGHRSRAPPERRGSVVPAWMREYRGQENDEGGRCSKAMLHWRDPIERHRPHRHLRHRLVDHNPASG